MQPIPGYCRDCIDIRSLLPFSPLAITCLSSGRGRNCIVIRRFCSVSPPAAENAASGRDGTVLSFAASAPFHRRLQKMQQAVATELYCHSPLLLRFTAAPGKYSKRRGRNCIVIRSFRSVSPLSAENAASGRDGIVLTFAASAPFHRRLQKMQQVVATELYCHSPLPLRFTAACTRSNKRSRRNCIDRQAPLPQINGLNLFS